MFWLFISFFRDKHKSGVLSSQWVF